ncbi:MAG: hypothetical protein EB832_02450 [Thaumarchaeota archaeon S14]|nr:MAG: hypothetical protein EB832_02450 [Thaumarchaeota archaeon S14]
MPPELIMAVRLRLVAGVFLDECELRGKEGLSLLGIVDSGASPTYVTVEARRSAHLEPTGSQKRSCVSMGKTTRELRLDRTTAE